MLMVFRPSKDALNNTLSKVLINQSSRREFCDFALGREILVEFTLVVVVAVASGIVFSPNVNYNVGVIEDRLVTRPNNLSILVLGEKSTRVRRLCKLFVSRYLNM